LVSITIKGELMPLKLSALPWKVALFFLAATINCVALADTFVPTEQLVSPQPDLVDYEFSASRNQIVWSDSTGSLWTADVDPDTGYFKPITGKGTLIDNDALTTTDLAFTYNGPEWVSTANGDQIVYTKFLPDYPHFSYTGHLALARQASDGAWSYRMLGPNSGSEPRLGPYASNDANDPYPRITYMDNRGNHYWRYIISATTEEATPGLPPSVKSVRFIQGKYAVVFATPDAIDGTQQLFIYHLITKKLEQITFDGGNKDLQTVPWIWQAPEFNNHLVLLTVVDDMELRFYHLTDNGDGTNSWTVFYQIPLPSGSKVASPEPFIYNGKSYISMVMTIAPYEYPTQVWISNIDASNPIMRKVNDDSLDRARIDPEVYVTTQGPYVYYNRFDPSLDPNKIYCGPCSEGVFRAYVGTLP
jgi:hypothetical protein